MDIEVKQNPIYEIPLDEFPTSKVVEDSSTPPDSVQSKHTSGRRMSGRMCAISTAALFAILLVLALVGVSAIVVFRPTASESKTEASVSSDLHVAMIQEDMKNLRQLVDEIATTHSANISTLKEEHSTALLELQQQQNGANERNNVFFQELLNQQNESQLTIQELQNQQIESKLTIQDLHNEQNESKLIIQELKNRLLNLTQTIEQQLVQLEVTDQNIDAKIDNSTRLHQQSYLDYKETVLTLNEETQRNVSQQIQLQASKFTEDILSLQLQANYTNRTLQTLQTDIDTLKQTTTNIQHELRSAIYGKLLCRLSYSRLFSRSKYLLS